jgi:hypothetical protein
MILAPLATATGSCGKNQAQFLQICTLNGLQGDGVVGKVASYPGEARIVPATKKKTSEPGSAAKYITYIL